MSTLDENYFKEAPSDIWLNELNWTVLFAPWNRFAEKFDMDFANFGGEKKDIYKQFLLAACIVLEIVFIFSLLCFFFALGSLIYKLANGRSTRMSLMAVFMSLLACVMTTFEFMQARVSLLVVRSLG